MKFERHLFVCVNERPVGGRPSCGGRALYEALSAAVLSRGELCARVAVTPTGCLGPCFDGPVAVVYGRDWPEGVWYAGVQASDAETIVDEHLAAGRPVERLRYRWPDD